MKRCKLFMLVAIAAFAFSCVTPSERISDFVAKVETDCDSYSADDWERIDAEFDRLCTDIESNYETMTEEEQEQVMKAVGVYFGLRTKHGLNDMLEEAKKAYKSLPSIIDGFTDAFEE